MSACRGAAHALSSPADSASDLNGGQATHQVASEHRVLRPGVRFLPERAQAPHQSGDPVGVSGLHRLVAVTLQMERRLDQTRRRGSSGPYMSRPTAVRSSARRGCSSSASAGSARCGWQCSLEAERRRSARIASRSTRGVQRGSASCRVGIRCLSDPGVEDTATGSPDPVEQPVASPCARPDTLSGWRPCSARMAGPGRLAGARQPAPPAAQPRRPYMEQPAVGRYAPVVGCSMQEARPFLLPVRPQGPTCPNSSR